MLKMPEKIESERIVLVRPNPPTIELAKEIFEKVELSRKTLRDWLPWVAGTKTPEDEYTGWLINWVQNIGMRGVVLLILFVIKRQMLCWAPLI